MDTADTQWAAVEEVMAGRSILSRLTPAERGELMAHARLREWQPGEVLCRQQEANDRLSILVSGRVRARTEVGGRSMVLGELEPGEIIGEISAVFQVPCIASVEALEPVTVVELPGELVRRWANERLALHEAILDLYRQRILYRALRAVALFATVPDAELAQVVEAAALQGAAPGTCIVCEGEQGDAFYVVLSGEVEVVHETGGAASAVARLHPGDYFGEWSLLTGAPRTGSVYARSRVDLVSIECGPFLAFIQRNPQVRESLDLVAHRRRDGEP